MTLLAGPWILVLAAAAEPPNLDPTAQVASHHAVESSAFLAPGAEAPSLAHGPVAVQRLGWRAPLRLPRPQQSSGEGPPMRDAEDRPRRRSRNLLLGAVAAEVAAGALLGGAIAAKGTYEDTDEPTRGLYRANRVLGHAGYASAIAGGALFLGSIRMWEW